MSLLIAYLFAPVGWLLLDAILILILRRFIHNISGSACDRRASMCVSAVVISCKDCRPRLIAAPNVETAEKPGRHRGEASRDSVAMFPFTRSKILLALPSLLGMAILGGCDELERGLRQGQDAESGTTTDDQPGDVTDQATPPPDKVARSDTSWPKQHTIGHGDTLYSLARAYYGDGSKWELIAKANPGVEASGLLVGKQLVVPPPQ